MDLHAILKNIGLKNKESSVYLKLLELGEASPLELSRQTGLKRPTLYLVLQSLETKGFALKIAHERKTVFSAQHPKKLILDMEMKVKDFSSMLPQMEHLTRQGAVMPRTLVFEGMEALDRAYDKAFISKGEILFMSTLGLSKKLFPRTFRKLDYATLSAEFKVRELVDESIEGKDYAKKVTNQFRIVRYIPKKHLPFEADIGIFDNTVLITSTQKKYFTVGIESPEIARVFRTFFELMWNVSKKPKS